MQAVPSRWVRLALGGALLAGVACGGRRVENAGQACSRADQCYGDLDVPLRGGAAVCLTRVRGGYCTHPCDTDADCCAVPGECRSDRPQVCAPFESTKGKLCFLGCEARDEREGDEASRCGGPAEEVGLVCRSSGGGAANRKVCVPPG
jgi:hypothetical protein